MSERQLWERMPDESPLWFGRFERYRLMWPHSVVEVYREEWREEQRKAQQGQKEEKKGPGRIDPFLEGETPKEAPGKWYTISKQWNWEERAAAWDAVQTAEIEKHLVEEKTKVLLTGYAVMHRRVATLNEMAERLFLMMRDPNKVWLPDVKAVGTGEFAERVDLVQFNAPLFHEIRACLDDIAKELGERSKKSEVTITTLPKLYMGTDPDEDGVNP